MLRLNKAESTACIIAINVCLFMFRFGGPVTALALAVMLNMVVSEALQVGR